MTQKEIQSFALAIYPTSPLLHQLHSAQHSGCSCQCHTHMKNTQRGKFVQTIYLNCCLLRCLFSLRKWLLFLQLFLNNYLGEIRARMLPVKLQFLSYHCAAHLNQGNQNSQAHSKLHKGVEEADKS